MERLIRDIKSWLFLFAICSGSILGQSKCFTSHAGAMIIQGEAMGRGMISDDVGYGINFTLGTQLTKNLHFTVVASRHTFSIDYMMPGREASYYYGASHHSSAGIGLMLFPFQKGRYASLYQSYSPYIHGTAGIVLQRNSIEDAINMPFTLHPGTFILPYGELLFGLKMRLNPRWSLDIFGGGRTTFTDEIDGMSGTGAGPDLLGRIGIGLCKRF